MDTKRKKGPDVIDKVLDACYQHNPHALFTMSLMHQYEERGSLSKKQLEGLLSKAKKIKSMPENWIATLEAIVLKMPTREKSPAAVRADAPIDKGPWLAQIQAILALYPQHKRVLFLQQKLLQQKQLEATDAQELMRFYRLLVNESK